MPAKPFQHVIETEEALREVIGHPSKRIAEKGIPEINNYCAGFIAQSPFILIASHDAHGNTDISPKGDPAGFVQVYDNKTLLIPDRPGNRRADTLTNILQTGSVAIFFMVPGRKETLRVNGTAQIVMDEDLRDQFVMKGKRPLLLIAVTVQEAFFHCTKCIVRSNLWDETNSDLPSLAEIIVTQGNWDVTVEAVQADLELDEQEGLY